MRTTTVIIAALLCLGAAAVPAWTADVVRVAAVLSHDTEPYRAAVDGFSTLTVTTGTVQVESFVLPPAGSTAGIVTALRRLAPPLILTVGTTATRTVAAEFTNVPIVACLVMDLADAGYGPNVTGVELRIPPDVQMTWLRHALPHGRVIGVMYDPATNGPFLRKLLRAADRGRFELLAREVTTPRDLPNALRLVLGRADVLLGIPDELVYSSATARAVLVAAFRSRVPLVGISPSWVKAGALYCLHTNNRDMGLQCADMAERLLAGRTVTELPPQPPRTVLCSVNPQTAHTLNLPLPGTVGGGPVRRIGDTE